MANPTPPAPTGYLVRVYPDGKPPCLYLAAGRILRCAPLHPRNRGRRGMVRGGRPSP